jgi:hypothetical protein
MWHAWQDRKTYKVFVGKPYGKRPLGKLRRRWEIGSEWILLVRETDWWSGVDSVDSGYGWLAGSCEPSISGATELVTKSTFPCPAGNWNPIAQPVDSRFRSEVTKLGASGISQGRREFLETSLLLTNKSQITPMGRGVIVHFTSNRLHSS